MIDPQRDLIAHLRTAPELNGIIQPFARPGLSTRAVFRSEAPANWKTDELPFIIVDPVQEGARSFGSFSSRAPMIDVPVRLFALMRDEGDAKLHAAAMAVRGLILLELLTLTGAVLNDVDCSFPEETPTSGATVGGRRLIVRVLITETTG